MGYNSNAALAYDMNAMPAYREAPQAPLGSNARRVLMSTRARAVRQTRR
mgnify:CR=1 FL=1